MARNLESSTGYVLACLLAVFLLGMAFGGMAYKLVNGV